MARAGLQFQMVEDCMVVTMKGGLECEFVLSELCIIVLQAENIIHLVMGVG